MCFLDTLVLFKLNLGQISFNPVENAFTKQQLAFLATSIAFYHIVTQAWAEIKILGEKVTYVFRLFDFWNFLIDLLMGLLAVKKNSEIASSRRVNFSMEQPGVVAEHFALSF